MLTYTAIFGSVEAPEDEPVTDTGSDTAPADIYSLKLPLLVGGVVVILGAGGVFILKKLKERR